VPEQDLDRARVGMRVQHEVALDRHPDDRLHHLGAGILAVEVELADALVHAELQALGEIARHRRVLVPRAHVVARAIGAQHRDDAVGRRAVEPDRLLVRRARHEGHAHIRLVENPERALERNLVMRILAPVHMRIEQRHLEPDGEGGRGREESGGGKGEE